MKVRIYKPSKTAMQSIHAKKLSWFLECELTSKRSPEPLMGWTQSDDTLNQIKLKFPTKEAAIAHAEREGWDYTVTVHRDRRVKPQNYMDNFKFVPSEDGR